MRDFGNVGPALRWLRRQRGLTQAQVASAAGVTAPMLSAYETSKMKPSFKTIDRILASLECDVEQLIRALEAVAEADQPAPFPAPSPPPPVPEPPSQPVFRAQTPREPSARETSFRKIVARAFEPGELEPAEEEILVNLLPGLVRLMRYLKG